MIGRLGVKLELYIRHLGDIIVDSWLSGNEAFDVEKVPQRAGSNRGTAFELEYAK